MEQHNNADSRCKHDDGVLAVWLLGALLAFAPLVQGGNHPLPLLVLELGSLLVFARLFGCPAFRHHLPKAFLLLLAVLFLVPLAYLLPLPMEYWAQLPGREWYRDLIAFAADDGSTPAWRQIAILPFRSEAGWYSLYFPLAVFLLAAGMSQTNLRRLVTLVVAMAVFQAVLGLIQFGQGPHSPLRFGNPFYTESAVGTYVSRNHMVALLYVALPLALVQMLNAVSPLLGASGSEGAKGGRRARRRRRLESAELGKLLLYGALSTAILIGMVFTRSRAGILVGISGLVLTGLLFLPRLGRRGLLATVGIVAVVSLLAVLATGVAPVLARFAGADTIDNQRWEIFSAAFQAAQAFFPLGAGPAGFPDVFPRFQPIGMAGFVNRAHNDYLELFFDGGLLMTVPAAVLVIVLVLVWWRRLRNPVRDSFTDLQRAAGLGLALVLIHSLLDFNLHIPANMGYFAFLAGLMMHKHRPQVHRQRRNGPGRRSRSGALQAPQQRPIPEANRVNPFAE